MPLFFIASGWMTNWGKYSFNEFLLRKFKSLVIPFLYYSAIVLIWRELTIGGVFTTWLLNGWGGYALWFIPVLFFALIIAKSIYTIANNYGRIAIVAGLIAIGCALCYNGILLPWTISTVPYAVFLVIAGCELKRFQEEVEALRWWILLLCTAITIIISLYYRLDLCCNCILPLIPLTVAAFTGTMMVFILSSYIAKYMKPVSIILQSVGKETYIVVAFSQIIIMTFNQYITHSALIKYSMLIVLLLAIKYGKDGLISCVKMKR